MRSRLRSTVDTVVKLLGPRTRRSWITRTRAHIEIRKLAESELAAFTSALKKELELERVQWVEVNPALFRAIIAFEEGAFTLAELMEHVERAERTAGVHDASFQDTSWEHPADIEAAERLILALAADALGAVAGFGLKFSPLPASRLAGTAASLLQIVQSSPRLRRVLDERFGPLRADLQLSMGAALGLGLAQRPGSALVELAHRAVQLAEVQSRARVWEEREPELFAQPSSEALPMTQVEARPRPLPRGPIEEYADRAVLVSLGGFAISLLTTRSVQRAVAALFGGVPKPARLGRDVFAAELGRTLSKRGILVIDGEVLRRLDRVDCLVLSSDLVARSRFVVRELSALGSEDEPELRRLLSDLFDADEPLARRERNGVFAMPLGLCGAALADELKPAVETLGQHGGLAIAIGRGNEVVALAEVELIPRTGVEEIVTAAHEAQMRVVIASADDSALEGLAADDIIPQNEGLLRGVRRLQREGRAVCVVATDPDPGLAAADCAIGIYRNDGAAPFGAHILCTDDLSEVRFLINACVSAKQVAKQSVNIALGAATLGALVSAGGVLPMTGRRVIRVVNAASMVSMLNGARGSFQLNRKQLPPPRDRTPWHALDARAVMSKLGTSRDGLNRRDAIERRRKGPAPRSSLTELAEAVSDELFNPLAPLLAAGAGLSAAVGSYGDAAMVGGVVSLSALVGGVQRFRTERAIRVLAQNTRRRAMVRRNGQLYDIDASDLVHGDLVVLAAGDVVPADCRVIEAESLEIDSSSMTGESLPVRKGVGASFEAAVPDRSSMLYEGTSIAAGRAMAVVVAVGEETEARRGAVATKQDASRGGVERRLRSLIQLTGPVALGAGVGLIGAGLLRGRKLEDLVGSGVSLAVASVPEGLPLLATAAQLAAADRLAKRGALVRNVRSIEALGRIDVLCVDKTGTLTQGRIELGSVSDGALEQRLPDIDALTLPVLAAALRATPAPAAARHFDQIDAALRRAGEELSVVEDYDRSGFRRHWELNFEAGRGYHATFSDHSEGSAIDVKGAPEAVLSRCTSWKRRGQRTPLDTALASELAARASELARRGLRVLAVAERLVARGDSLDPERLFGLTFLGFLAFRDPVRPSAARALNDLAAAGVRTIMLTGDHPSTAEAVAREIGLVSASSGVMTGAALAELSDDELDRRIRGVTVFARVTPAQKVRLVRALQRAGRVVAMVGDGANDAPAIRLANVGVALGEQSTAAARAAADIVLTDERIETLVDAVSEGRAMWASVRDAVSILVGGNLGEIGFTLGAGLIDGRPPLNARQLLLVNLLTDVAPAMAIALRPPTAKTLASLANEGPDASLGQPLNREIAARAAVTALGASSAWVVGRFTGTRTHANTVGLVALVGTQLGQTLVSGRFSRPVVLTSLASAGLLGAIIQTPGVSQAFGCRPLGPIGWTTALGASAAATGASVYYAEVIERLFGRFGFQRPVLVEDPEALPPGG